MSSRSKAIVLAILALAAFPAAVTAIGVPQSAQQAAALHAHLGAVANTLQRADAWRSALLGQRSAVQLSPMVAGRSIDFAEARDYALRPSDFERFIDPRITGPDRAMVLRLMQQVPPNMRSNFCSASAGRPSHREHTRRAQERTRQPRRPNFPGSIRPPRWRNVHVTSSGAGHRQMS